MKIKIKTIIPLTGKTITTGLALISLTLLPTACKETPENPSPDKDKDTDTTVEKSIVDWELEELTVTELKPIPLSEIFERTRATFVVGDRTKTAEQVKIIANFFIREAATRNDETKEAFNDFGKELYILASLMETEGLVLKEDLEVVFANAHLILALDRATNAQTAAKKNLREKVGENIKSSMEHAKQALNRAGKKTTAEMSKAADAIGRTLSSLEDGAELAKDNTVTVANKTVDFTLSITKEVKNKIKDGAKSTTRKTKEMTGKLLERTGKVVEKMGQQMKNKGSKIKQETPTSK